MASAIADVSALPGETVWGHDGEIGKIKRLYATGDGGDVMWVTIELSRDTGSKLEAFVPLARLKMEDDELRVPYTAGHIQSAPEVEAGEELSEQDDRALRDYYSVGLGDREVRTDNDTYAGQVPAAEGAARRIDPDDASAPERDTGQGAERMHAEAASKLDDKPRKVTAAEAFDDD